MRQLTHIIFILASLIHLGCGRLPRHAHGGHKHVKSRGGSGLPPRHHSHHTPYFDELQSSRNMTIIQGETAIFQCVVRNVGNKSVSWLRNLYPIPELLALNNITNTPDPRVASFHVPGTERFVLRLQHTRLNDSGFYECQVAGTGSGGSLFRLIHLQVVEPITEILGGPDIYVDRGSTLNITCAVSAGAKKPEYIYWTRNKQIVLFDGGETSARPFLLRDSSLRWTSRLVIEDMKPDQAGVYTCQPASASPINVTVHVINGTVLAVADADDSSSSSSSSGSDSGSSVIASAASSETLSSSNEDPMSKASSSISSSSSSLVQGRFPPLLIIVALSWTRSELWRR